MEENINVEEAASSLPKYCPVCFGIMEKTTIEYGIVVWQCPDCGYIEPV